MMVDTMKEAFSGTLQRLPWMSVKSRTAALEKLAGMMDLIGYPEQVNYVNMILDGGILLLPSKFYRFFLWMVSCYI